MASKVPGTMSESTFRTFVAQFPCPAFIQDAGGRYMYGNDAWARLFDQPADVLLGKTEALHSVAVADTLKGLRSALAAGKTQSAGPVTGFAKSDPDAVWHVTIFVLNSDDTEAMYGGYAVDVTQQSEFERFARLQLERLRLATLVARDVIYDWDVATDKVWRSEAVQDLLGSTIVASDELDFWVSRIHPDDFDRVHIDVNAALDSNRDRWTSDYRMRRENGSYAYVTDRGYIVRDHEGRAVRMIGACADVTQLHETIDALRDSEARFQVMADTAPVLIWVSDPKGCREYFNRRWLEFTGREITDEVADGWVQGIHADDVARCQRTYHDAVEHGDEFELEYRLRRYDGQFRWILDRGTPRRTAEGAVTGYIGSCLDLTQRRRADDRLRALQGELTQAHRLSTLGEMSASLAHELNQPLQAMMTYCGALLQRLPDGSESSDPQTTMWARETVQRIENQASRAGDVLDRVRRLLSPKPSEVAITSVNAIVEEVFPVCHAEAQYRNVELRWEPSDGLPLVRVDRVQLQQVVLNLVRNALDACEAERERAESTEKRGVDVCIGSKVGSDGRVRIEIRDRGTGLAVSDGTRVFEPFFSTKSNGMGMGLSICQRIVEAHRGRIWHEENLHGGTAFIIELPADHGAGT